MPWVNQELCTGCGTCVEECPVDAITLTEDDVAQIDDEQCIRCGTCHDVCPVEAVRHDSERIPEEVEANLRWVRNLMGHFETDGEKRELVGRMVRYFAKERKVAEQTIERLQSL
jgi:Fe-S-cluster-containing hydrogenase component 2